LLQKWLTHSHCKKTYRNDQNLTISSTLVIRWRIQGYRCEAGTDIYGRKLEITLTVPLNKNHLCIIIFYVLRKEILKAVLKINLILMRIRILEPICEKNKTIFGVADFLNRWIYSSFLLPLFLKKKTHSFLKS